MSLFLFKGVVRIHLLEAERLASKDNYVKGVIAGMSDPYALLRVGPQTFKSRHLDNTLNPKWDEMFEVSRAESHLNGFIHCVVRSPTHKSRTRHQLQCHIIKILFVICLFIVL